MYPMRCAALFLMCWFLFGAAGPAQAATGRVIKVLPHFLDLEGRHTLAPSLYERDAYQAFLREHPDKRSGIRFDVHFKASGPAFGKLKLRLELRGIAQGDLPRQLVLEQEITPTGGFGRWTGLSLRGQEYRQFGEVTAWRLALWDIDPVMGDQLLSEQQSFLWQ